MTEHRLSILHISDLHARSQDVDELPEDAREKRRREVRLEAASRAKVLGDAWDVNLRELYPSGERPDLVCFTGDVADWGLGSEYAEATKLIDRLVAVLGVERSQIYVVPGNHDVRRTNPKRDEDKVAHQQWEAVRELARSDTHATSNWLAGRSPPRAVEAGVVDTVMGRTAAFWRWVEHGLRRPELLPADHVHGRLGYHHVHSLPHLPFPVHVIGLDSAWLAGDDHDQGKLWLTEHQRDLLLHDDEGKPWNDGFRLALVHHPIEELAQPERDATRRDLANAVDLLLHGHQHDPVGVQHIDPDGRVLRVLAAGCLFEGGEGSRWKNGCHRIDVALDGAGRPLRANIHFRAWSSRGHWHSDSSLYRTAKDGRLVWHAWGRDSGPRLISNLGERPPVFEGRGDELEKIRQALAKEGSAAALFSAVVGLGGVGKSRLALEYASVGDYDVRWWVRAGAIATLQGDLVELGQRLGIVGQVENVERAAGEVVEWLSKNERWLLVLDDATGPEAVRAALGGLLRDRCPGHVLITSRAQAWRSVAVPIEITTLSPEAAKAVLLRRSGRQDDGSAATIAKQLGYLPLALVQAGAYMDATGCSLREYLERLEKHGLVLFEDHKAATGDYYQQTVAVTWEISLAAIREESPAAAALLDWLSFLDPDGVPVRLLLEHGEEVPADVAACLESELVLDDAIAVLRRFSMVDRVEQPEVSLRVHRLVQAVTRKKLGDERLLELAAAVVAWVVAVFDYRPDVTLIKDVPEGIGEQLMAVCMLDVSMTASDLALTSALNALVSYRVVWGMLAAARAASERSLEMAEALVKIEPHGFQSRNELAVSLERLGDVEERAGNLGAARHRILRSLQIRESLAKEDPGAQTQRSLSVSLNKFGDAEVQAGNLAAGLDLFRRTLRTREALAREDPLSVQAQHDLSVSLNKLSDAEVKAGNLAAAREFAERSVRILEKLVDADPLGSQAQRNLSIALDTLGNVEIHAGNFAAARKLFLRSLHTRERLAATDLHNAQAQREVTVSLVKLGDVEAHAGKLATGREYFQRCVGILDTLSRTDSYNAQAQRDLSVSLAKLGDIEVRSGDILAARSLFQRSFQMLEALEAADPHNAEAQRDLSASLDNLGNLEGQAGNLSTARDLFQRSLHIRERLAMADPHNAQAKRDISVSRNLLGNAELLANNLAVARQHFEVSLEIREALVLSNSHSAQAKRDISASLDNLGNIELRTGNLGAARGLFQRSLEVAKELAKTDPHSAQAQRDLSISFEKMGMVEAMANDPAAAQNLLQRSLGIREALAKTNPHSADAAFDVVLSFLRLAAAAEEVGDLKTVREIITAACENLASMDAKGQIAGDRPREAVRDLFLQKAEQLGVRLVRS